MRRNIEIMVGGFILLGIAALALLAVQVSSGAEGGDTFRIYGRFDNVGGLTEKSPVMIGGVRIGRVGDISMDTEYFEAVVGMDIDARYDTLPLDTSASILTAGLLGAQFVGLQPGADDIYLEAGDTIDITQSALQLESLISRMLFSQGKSGGDTGGESSP